MQRIPELDSIRGLAAIAILAYHLAPNRFEHGWAAVDCFFVLSSFLITSNLLEHRNSERFFINFYFRRAIRIWPIYYLCLFSLVMVNSALGIGESLDGLAHHIVYFQNVSLYWGDVPPSFIRAFSHTWTLALEEQYYILWPPMVYFCGRRTLIAISLSAVIGSIALRQCGMSVILLGGRCDGFALGGLIALLLPAGDPQRSVRAIVIFGVAAFFVSIGPWNAPDRIAYCTFGFFGLIGLVVLRSGDRWLAILRSRELMYVGAISYGLYLYHIPIDRGCEILLRSIGVHHRLDEGYPLWRTAAEFALTFVAAIISWHCIEKPLLILKSRFQYGKGAKDN